MAKLRSVVLRNYRRFAGEIELPLAPGVNLIAVPPGHGKSTVLEAISWGLLGPQLVPGPEQVPNVDALGKGMAEVMVGLEFVNGERLERFAIFSQTSGEVEQVGWGWRLVDVLSGAVVAGDDDAEEFADQQERLFPEVCVHAGLISGPGLRRMVQGCRSGVEMAVECSNVWCTSDLSLRCSKAATDLFQALRPEAPVNALGYDPQGRLELEVTGPLDEADLQLAMLSHALAFAKEGATVCPVFIDDPFSRVGELEREPLFRAVLDALPSRQLVFLLSEDRDIDALRSTGRVDKELEIRG